jgi:DNA-directed RNA polymerase specialized sigma24 family protein
MLGVGVAIDHFTAALAGVALGVAEGTVRAAYRRALARKVRAIGH